MYRHLFFSLALILLFLLTSCGPSRRIVKTDSKTEIETTIKKIDTTKTEAAWQSVVDHVISQIDLSTIRIVTYYPTIDSSGKQAIQEDITIEKNIVTNSAQNSKENAVITEQKGIKEDTSQTIQNREIEKVTEKKIGLPVKYYLIGFIVLAGIGYLAYQFIRHQFF